jgi:hypothetical protein
MCELTYIGSDPTQQMKESVSEPLWHGYDTIEQWRNFVVHDFPHPSRPVAYATVRSVLVALLPLALPPTLGEVGFGSLYDFKWCFKPLHDEGMIAYTGIDFMQQFVDYAKTDYPDYAWMQGELATLEQGAFDIVYTRHTFQHQSPTTYAACLTRFLGAARRYAVLCWHPPLGATEHIHYEHSGYCNTYAQGYVDQLIRECGFEITQIPADEDTIYCMKRVS